MGATPSRACCDLGVNRAQFPDSPLHFRPPKEPPSAVEDQSTTSRSAEEAESFIAFKSAERAKKISIARGASQPSEQPNGSQCDNGDVFIDNYTDEPSTTPKLLPANFESHSNAATNSNAADNQKDDGAHNQDQSQNNDSNKVSKIESEMSEMKSMMLQLMQKNQSLEKTCSKLQNDFNNERFDAEQRELDIIQRHYSELAKHASRDTHFDNFDNCEGFEECNDGIQRVFTGDLKPIGSPAAVGVHIPTQHDLQTPVQTPKHQDQAQRENMMEPSDEKMDHKAKDYSKMDDVVGAQFFDISADAD